MSGRRRAKSRKPKKEKRTLAGVKEQRTAIAPKPEAPPPTVQGSVPPQFRERLEQTRLELRALYRSLDHLGIAQEQPMRPELSSVCELDADLAEALAVLDKPLWRFNVARMVRDIEGSLARIPAARDRLLQSLDEKERRMLLERLPVARAGLYPDEAYLEIPGKDPIEEAEPLSLDRDARQQLLRLRRTDESWVGCRRSLSTYVASPTPYRPDIAVWIDTCAGEVVGHDLLRPEEGDRALLDLLVRAMLAPAAGEPRRPATVGLTSARLACGLGPALAAAQITVAPTDGKVVEDFATLLEARMRRDRETVDPFESYLEAGRIPAEAVARFFHAAAKLFRSAPWKVSRPEHAFGVEIGRWGCDRLCVAIPPGGARKAVFAFRSFDDYVTFSHRLGLWGEAENDEPFEPMVETMSISFLSGGDVPPGRRREALEEAWEVAASEAFPDLMKMDASGIRVPLTDDDYRVAAAVAESVAEFVTRHPRLLAEEAPATVTEEVLVEGEPELRVQVTAPQA